MKVDFKRLSQLVSAVAVWHNFNNSAEKFISSGPIANTPVRSNEQVEIVLFENSLKMFYELKCQDILS